MEKAYDKCPKCGTLFGRKARQHHTQTECMYATQRQFELEKYLKKREDIDAKIRS